MKIKVALLDVDQEYLNRICTAFLTRYADRMEIYSFTSQDLAVQTIKASKLDVLVASEQFEGVEYLIPEKVGLAYLVNSSDIERLNDKPAVCKYQKVEMIYKQILAVYAENAGNLSEFNNGAGVTEVIAFTSPCGGVGSSSLAMAAAKHYAKNGIKTLYLGLEKFGNPGLIFEGLGQYDFSDIVFALKSHKANIYMKFESVVRQDESGVFYVAAAKHAMDMVELTADEIKELVKEIVRAGEYKKIILDLDFTLGNETISVLDLANTIIVTSDGSEIANEKIVRAWDTWKIVEQKNGVSLITSAHIFYNKFSNKTSHEITEVEIHSIGGSPRFEHASCKEVVNRLSELNAFDNIGI